MDLKPDRLSRTVIHWLEYERLCRRSHLFSESSLKSPIAEYLQSNGQIKLVAEEPYPARFQTGSRRPKSVDFCLKRKGGSNPWTNIIESKWVSGKRDLSQEVFDDILRLEAVRRDQAGQFKRYFVIAGFSEKIEEIIWEKEYNTGNNSRKNLFKKILPRAVGERIRCEIRSSSDPIKKYWESAANSFGVEKIPCSMSIELEADTEEKGKYFRCFIWRIFSTPNGGHYKIQGV